MKDKTKKIAIALVIVAALTAFGYFFINTTAKIEASFAKVGAIAVAVIIIVVAIALIVAICKIKKAGEERATKKAAKKAEKELEK